MTHEKTLAQRAADELSVEDQSGFWNASRTDYEQMQTTMRLIAKNDELQACVDELEAQPTRRTEPMPEPVPEWLRVKVLQEIRQDEPSAQSWCYGENCIRTFARLIWERGDVQDVDPAEALAREALKAWHEDGTVDSLISSSPSGFAAVVAVIKRGMELAKEIAP
jgi:hypothetical protein